MRFRELPDYELERLSEDGLLAYVVAGRDADRPDAALRGLYHLLFRNLTWVRAMIARKAPPQLVDDLAAEALEEALGAAFDGTTGGEFGSWLKVIVARHLADFYRGPRGRQLEADKRAPDPYAADPSAPADDPFALADLNDVVERVLATRSAAHREVIERYVFQHDTAKEAAAATGESEDNVYKIAQRFRDDLRAALDDGDTGMSA